MPALAVLVKINLERIFFQRSERACTCYRAAEARNACRQTFHFVGKGRRWSPAVLISYHLRNCTFNARFLISTSCIYNQRITQNDLNGDEII